MKKLISVLLAALMLACILPLAAFAEGLDEEEVLEVNSREESQDNEKSVAQEGSEDGAPPVEDFEDEEEIGQELEEDAELDGASTLSEGNLTIVCTVAGVALGLVGGIVIGRKKKKPESANE